MIIRILLLYTFIASVFSQTQDRYEISDVGDKETPTEITYSLESIFDNKTVYLGIKSGTGYGWVVDDKSFDIEAVPFGSKYEEPVYGGKGVARYIFFCKEGNLCKNEYVQLVYLKTWLITKWKDEDYSEHDSYEPRVIKFNINFPHEKYFEEDFTGKKKVSISDRTKNIELQPNEKFMIELDRVIGSPFNWVIFNQTSNLDITFLGVERVGKGDGGKEVMSWDVIPSENLNETDTKGQIILVYIKEELLEIYRKNQNEVFSAYLQRQPQRPVRYVLNVEIVKAEASKDDEEGFKITPEVKVREVVLPDENVENLDQAGNEQSQTQSQEGTNEVNEEAKSKEDL